MILSGSDLGTFRQHGPLAGDPLPVYPVTLPAREAPSALMQPLNWLMNTRSAALHTPSHGEGITLFRAPYLLANPLNAPTTFVHSPNPHLIARDNSLASVTCTLNPVEEEYLCTLQLTPQTAQDAHQIPEPPQLATPQPQPMYIPPWSPAQPASQHQSQCLLCQLCHPHHSFRHCQH